MKIQFVGNVTSILISAAFLTSVTNSRAETIAFESGNPSYDLNGATLETTAGTIGIGEVASATPDAYALTGIATCWPSGSSCDPGGEPVAPANAASAIDHYWVQGDPAILFTFSTPISEVVAVSGIDHGPLPGEALEFIVYATDANGYVLEEGAIKAVYDDGVDGSTGGAVIGGPGSGSSQITAAESDDFSSVWTFSEPYSYFIVQSGDHLAGFSSPGEFEIDGLASAEVAATNCTTSAGGCNPTGAQLIELSTSIEFSPDATIEQTSLTIVDDPLRCGHSPLLVDIPGTDNDLYIPEFLCGSPDFVVLITRSTGIDFSDGTVITTNEPGAFFADPLPCDSPINGLTTDPQQQDVMVWQPTVASDAREGRALELTFECGSSRGRTRGLSYFVVGLHIDFGLDWNSDPDAVRHAFIDLTNSKFHGFVRAVRDARRVLPRRQYYRLLRKTYHAKYWFRVGHYRRAERELSSVISLLGRLNFDTSGAFNHEGDIEMRAYNVRFMITDKIINIMN
jgi:hypothetical protein